MAKEIPQQNKSSKNHVKNNLKQKVSNYFDNQKNRELKVNYTLNTPLYGKNAVIYSPFLKRVIEKLDKKEKNKKSTLLPQKKSSSFETSSNILKKAIAVVICLGIWQNSNAIYLNLSNGDRTTGDDFTTEDVIENQNGNEFEIDDNGQIDPFPVTNEEKQECINNFKSYILQDAANFGIEKQNIKILSISCFQLDEVIQNGTFTNYLVSIKFATENDLIYDMQFYADQLFSFSSTQMSDINKLNEILSYVQNPDLCGLFNITSMDKVSQEIQNILNNRGNNVLFVGDVQWATANNGSIIYKIPIYNNDGTITVWTSDISSTIEIDINYSSPAEALISQLQGEADDLFSSTEFNNGDALNTINSILYDFQTIENIENNQENLKNKSKSSENYISDVIDQESKD